MTNGSSEPKWANKAEKQENKPLKENSIWMIVSVVLALLLLVSLFYNPLMPTGMATATVPGEGDSGETFDDQALAGKAVSFLNENFLAMDGVEAKLNSVIKLAEGLYEVTVDIYDQGELADTVPVIVSEDATKMVIGQVVDMTQPLLEPELPEAEDVPQLEKTKVEAFVMSFCPYGVQALEGLAPVAQLLGDKATIEPHFIYYSDYCAGDRCDPADYCYNGEEEYCSMHGVEEINENLRQTAIYNLDSKKYWEYVAHLIPRMYLGEVTTENVGETWKESAEAVGLDVVAVEAWVEENAKTVLSQEMQLSQFYGATGSPTVIVNGAQYSGARTPEAYKDSVCSGFLEMPEECSQELSSEGGTAQGSC